jgi:hypothetical protein
MNTQKNTFLDIIKQIAIVFAITILIPFTVHYGATLIAPYPSGDYYGTLIDGVYLSKSQLQDKIDTKSYKSPQQLESIKANLAKINKYNSQLYDYQSTLFYTCLAFGLLFIIIGLVFTIPIIDVGLVLGGSIALIDGYVSYWSELPKVLQFVSLIVALFLVIFITYFKLVRKRKHS